MDHSATERQIELARAYDSKLQEVIRKVCEPSSFGGGVKSRAALDSIKITAADLLGKLAELAEERKADNAALKEKVDGVEEWIHSLASELTRLEGIGEENGLQPLDRDHEPHTNGEILLCRVDVSSSGSKLGERKRSIPRRLFSGMTPSPLIRK